MGITLPPIMVSLAFFSEAMGVVAFVRKFSYFKLANTKNDQSYQINSKLFNALFSK